MTDLPAAREAALGQAELRAALRGGAQAVQETLRSDQPPTTTDADARHFRTLMYVVAAVELVIALLLAFAFVQHGRLDQLVGSVGLVALAGGMAIAARRVDRRSVGRAVVVIASGILAFSLAVSLAGNVTSTLAMTALVAVLVAVPYVDGRTLRRLSVAAYVTALVVGVNVALAQPPAVDGGPSLSITRFLGVAVNMAIALFVIVHLSGRLNATAQRYRDLFRRVPVGMYRTTPDGRFLDVNGAFAEMFGFDKPEDLTEVPAALLYADPADRVGFRTAVDRAGVVRAIEYRARRPDGTDFWLRDSALLVRDRGGKPLYYEGIVEDVTERKDHELRLKERASLDALTGLANRTVLVESIDDALDLASADEPVTLLFVDLDDFKNVNDAYGHAAGDAALVEASERLRVATRAQDTLARFGGDEFAVLLAAPTGKQAALAVAKRIAAAFAEPFLIHDGPHTAAVGASVGIALATAPMPAAELIRRADAAMYQAKGRGGVVVFEE